MTVDNNRYQLAYITITACCHASDSTMRVDHFYLVKRNAKYWLIIFVIIIYKTRLSCFDEQFTLAKAMTSG